MPDTRPAILYVINVDWFFLSHFLPLATEARRRGYRAFVACERTNRDDAFAAADIRLVPLHLSRSDRRLGRVWSAARQVAALIARERPAIVHAIGLEGMLVAVLARRLRPFGRFILAPTGLGYGSIERGSRRHVHTLLRHLIRTAAGAKADWVFENEDDPRRFGLRAHAATCLIVGGAGVDTAAFSPSPLPAMPPLRVAMVARMVWSKGPDLAVAAVTAMRAAGHDVELTLVGEPDAFNPRAIPRQTLETWNAMEGIRCIGHQTDIPSVWARHHVACSPSRGGEGLPKALLEAAASGRAIVTTDVPGCRMSVREGVDGFVVPPDDAGALAAALARFVAQPDLVERMGAAARDHAVAHHFDRDIAERVWDFSERTSVSRRA